MTEEQKMLRLLMAAAFMHAEIASGPYRDTAASIAKQAFEYADALIAEFEKTTP